MDDDVSIQRAVAPLLRSRGYHVDVVSTGVEAVKAVADERARPDRARPRPARPRRRRSLPPDARAHQGADRHPVGAQRGSREGRGARHRRRRLRHQAVRPRGTAGANPGRAAAGRRRRRRRRSSGCRSATSPIDFARHRVVRGDEEVRLTPKEFELLALLARNADRVLTHRAILKAIWGPNAVDQPEHLWVLMAQLRKKIEPDPGNAALSAQRAVGRLSPGQRAVNERSSAGRREVVAGQRVLELPAAGRRTRRSPCASARATGPAIGRCCCGGRA